MEAQRNGLVLWMRRRRNGENYVRPSSCNRTYGASYYACFWGHNSNDDDDHHHRGTRGEKAQTRGGTAKSGAPMESAIVVPVSSKPQRRFLIDYVYTAPESRDLGLAGRLVTTVLDMASSSIHDAHCYVLSLEDSCVYWMEKHQFFLCQSPGLNGLLNVFPDTHLLRRRQQPKLQHDDKANATTTRVDTNGKNGVANANNEHDSDEEEAMLRYKWQQEQESSDDSSQEESAGGNSGNGDNNKTPPESFTRALHDLLYHAGTDLESSNSSNTPRFKEMKTCLSTLAVLIQNAVHDNTEEGKRRKCRINNPNIHRRVFLVGGESAMTILQVCGFELQVDGDEGDVVLHFHRQNVGGGEDASSSWLDAAVVQLQLEATK